jgi:N-acetylmuramic acid 6-phosphate etherase
MSGIGMSQQPSASLRSVGSDRRPSERITERENPASTDLDQKSTKQILRLINAEDQKVPGAVAKTIPSIARAVDLASDSIARGGRLIYLGAGTSGRLGLLDAAECLPTFNTDRVVAVLAGGPEAMFAPVENAEDRPASARRDLRRIKLSKRDVLVGISASGRTPYTLAGVSYARSIGARTVAVTCNPTGPLRRAAEVAIVPVVGPEVIAGSSRMKAGTAQKLVLNMLSTATMVRLGRVFSGWMINLRVSNAKLRERGRRILMKASGASPAAASRAIRLSGGDLPTALLTLLKNISAEEAHHLLRRTGSPASSVRAALNDAGRMPRRNVVRSREKPANRRPAPPPERS